MRKLIKIVMPILIAAVTLMAGVQTLRAQIYVHNSMALVQNCTTTDNTCNQNPETGAWSGSKTVITGTWQACVVYPDADCPVTPCKGTTNVYGCP
jgi:hypothetical protein